MNFLFTTDSTVFSKPPIIKIALLKILIKNKLNLTQFIHSMTRFIYFLVKYCGSRFDEYYVI